MIIPSVDDISRISVIGGFLRTQWPFCKEEWRAPRVIGCLKQAQGDMRLPAIGSWKPIARLDQPQPSLDKRHWVDLHVAGNLCKNSSLDGPLDGQNIDHNLFPLPLGTWWVLISANICTTLSCALLFVKLLSGAGQIIVADGDPGSLSWTSQSKFGPCKICTGETGM